MTGDALAAAAARIVGAGHVLRDEASRVVYGADALQRGSRPDLVVRPGTTAEVSRIARLCHDERVPLTPRGAGTGYTGGAVPTSGGVVLALDRFDRILEIDAPNLLAVVQPNVVTAALQAEVEARGLFYPPDPASLHRSAIGGNVAECAGGPRAFKYGTTKHYVLGLEAVLPTGEVLRTGGKSVKNVVGYDLTQLLVGSEGTLAVLTEITLRLVPRPAAARTLRSAFPGVDAAVAAVLGMLAGGVVPAAVELIDGDCLAALAAAGAEPLAPAGAAALLLVEVDGAPGAVDDELARVRAACREAGATDLRTARDRREREALWRVRRDLSPALRSLAPLKVNHDVVVPRARVPALFRAVAGLRAALGLRIACFGHVGDGNIHVNILLDPADADAMARARDAERRLFEEVVALEGSISGEHGIGFTKAPYLDLELSPAAIALLRRLKQAFDPRGILNPGKIFPPGAAGDAAGR